VISGQVTKLVPFGAFIRVAPGIEGLVHISELSHEHVDTPESVLTVGDEVEVKVIDVDVTRRRVSLSMRQVSAPPVREPEIKVEPERREPAPEMKSTIQIPDDIVAAVAEADAARVDEVPEPVAAVEEAPAEAVAEQAVVEAAVAETEEAIAEVEVAEAIDEAVVDAAVDDAIVAEAEGDAAVVEADAEVAEAAADDAEAAADEEVSLEAILEDLKRREGRQD
jgi:small subunit ribosomal protein S1